MAKPSTDSLILEYGEEDRFHEAISLALYFNSHAMTFDLKRFGGFMHAAAKL
jgi:hypothetical protein